MGASAKKILFVVAGLPGGGGFSEYKRNGGHTDTGAFQNRHGKALKRTGIDNKPRRFQCLAHPISAGHHKKAIVPRHGTAQRLFFRSLAVKENAKRAILTPFHCFFKKRYRQWQALFLGKTADHDNVPILFGAYRRRLLERQGIV